MGKVDKGKAESETFLASYMTDRRHTYSTIISEITETATTAAMKMGDTVIAPLDPIEGSDDLDMMTISVDLEGNYAQLLKFVNLLDRSPRFLIIESMQAAPQAKGDLLNVNLKFNAFVRDFRAARYEMGADRKKVAILGVLLALAAVILYSNMSSTPDAPAPRPLAPPPRRHAVHTGNCRSGNTPSSGLQRRRG